MTTETTNAPARYLALAGTSNFRDLGGYVGHGGRSVRWRTLFRSDHLADLTPQGRAQLAELGVHTSVDFRGQFERAAHGYAWPDVHTHALTVEPTVVQKALAMLHAGGSITEAETVALMQATYASFVQEHAPRFAQLFELLLVQETPLVFHCTAGKDRTGWAAALILHALGVPRDVVMQDYLLTNTYYQRPATLAQSVGATVPPEILQVLWRVQPAFLEHAYVAVDATYGGLDTYLQEVLGVDTAALQHLRQRYLQA